MQETQVQSLGGEGPLEKGMGIHSIIPAWRTPIACILYLYISVQNVLKFLLIFFMCYLKVLFNLYTFWDFLIIFLLLSSSLIPF